MNTGEGFPREQKKLARDTRISVYPQLVFRFGIARHNKGHTI